MQAIHASHSYSMSSINCPSCAAAEGAQSELVVIGEKGRAQLQRDQASHIAETIADVGKLRITFSQVRRLCMQEELRK